MIVYILISGVDYIISPGIKIIPTPGHSEADVSVVVETANMGTVVIAGQYLANIGCAGHYSNFVI